MISFISNKLRFLFHISSTLDIHTSLAIRLLHERLLVSEHVIHPWIDNLDIIQRNIEYITTSHCIVYELSCINLGQVYEFIVII